IVLSYNTADETVTCIKSLLAEKITGMELVVVDNDSHDDSVAKLKRLGPKIKLIESKTNLGFAKGCNLGVQNSSGTYLCFVNSDSLVPADSLKKLVAAIDSRPDVAVAVPKLLNDDGSAENNIAHLPRTRDIVNEYLRGRVSGWYDIDRITKPTEVEGFS